MPPARHTRALAALLSAAALTAAAPAAAQAAEAIVAVDANGQLVTLRSDQPGAARRAPLTGLPAGETIVGLDRRPANGGFVALSSASRLYALDPNARTLTAVGSAPFAPALEGRSFGFDFNPTVDRIRLVSNTRLNLRLHPDTGLTAAVDGALSYAPGDPGAGRPSSVVASAYTNSVAGATSTVLFDIDSTQDTLLTQNPPNAGTLNTVGALGVNVSSPATFDISGTSGAALMTARPARARSTRLYSIDLATGRATLAGRIPGAPVVAATIQGTLP